MRIKKTLIILVSLFIFFAGLSAVALAKEGAQTVFAIDAGGLDETADAAFGAGKYSKTSSPQSIAGNVIGAILTMVGVLFLVLMIYGGIIWMMARGNEQQTQKALQTITAAVIGLVIVLGSYAFTNFIFTSVEGGGGGSCVNAYPYPLTGCNAVNCGTYTIPDDCAASNCCEWQQ